MGCDMHMFVEKKVDGQWVSQDKMVPDEFSEEPVAERLQAQFGTFRYKDGDGLVHISMMRNYNLFGILANVRNGYGLAGAPTGGQFLPISKPKGISEDASDEVKAELDSWGVDGHSHSWLTVKEILEWSHWTDIRITSGYISEKQYREFDPGKGPDSWAGGMAGPKRLMITRENFDALDEAGKLDKEIDYCINVSWPNSYKELVGDEFLLELMSTLQALDPDPANVRMVFWFDN